MTELETFPWDPAEHLHSKDDMIAYLEAAFEDGDALVVAAALDDIARALGRSESRANDVVDISPIVRRLKSLGFELSAKAA